MDTTNTFKAHLISLYNHPQHTHTHRLFLPLPFLLLTFFLNLTFNPYNSLSLSPFSPILSAIISLIIQFTFSDISFSSHCSSHYLFIFIHTPQAILIRHSWSIDNEIMISDHFSNDKVHNPKFTFFVNSIQAKLHFYRNMFNPEWPNKLDMFGHSGPNR